MAVLALINGAPGSGKSTVAAAVAARRPMALALDVDAIKHALGGWEDDAYAAGLQARRLALAVAERHLHDGHDVVIGQYLARVDFVEELERLAVGCRARFVEVVLHLDPPELAARLAQRSREPSRPEHEVNNALVGPEDVDRLVAPLEDLRRLRPRTTVVDAAGGVADVVDRVDRLIGR